VDLSFHRRLRCAQGQSITRSSATAEKQCVSCPDGWGVGAPAHFPSAPSGYTCAYGRIRKPQRTYVKGAVRKAHFKMNRAFKVIQGLRSSLLVAAGIQNGVFPNPSPHTLPASRLSASRSRLRTNGTSVLRHIGLCR